MGESLKVKRSSDTQKPGISRYHCGDLLWMAADPEITKANFVEA